MKVYALVGKSGTGKSYRAMEVANSFQIEMIIDDGLLIYGTKVVAGISAKKEKTKIAAIKRALFTSEEHVLDAKKAIKRYHPKSILIIGTSDQMVRKIQEVLELAPIQKTIYIEEISSSEEIQKAKKIRQEEGKHVIPVPAVEVKKFFSGYFLDPLKIFRKNSKNKHKELHEKTVVRPTYSYLGNYTVSNSVVQSLVYHIVYDVDGVYKVNKVNITSQPTGLKVGLDIIIVYGKVIPNVAKDIQQSIIEKLEYMTGQNILEVNIFVRGLWIVNES
ncbi:Asp23/Gls24 family envelope stress response protein [Garciella nitratireducens]|uniref:Asp23/Gls24 family envelope stress response protein n=1 Tax=Garciella nitratireducens TaxID=218205 RepID=UPI000DEB586F|nr:Asp23/Gls24 family envelope stress response protein [Garciella nitratireducens]RBP44111.1 putative alkaline shock family protein YloU [Garciella nitratireducens]